MKDNDGAIICLLMILNVSAYENVFLEQQFCAYKARAMLVISSMWIFSLDEQKKCAITGVMMPLYEHV